MTRVPTGIDTVWLLKVALHLCALVCVATATRSVDRFGRDCRESSERGGLLPSTHFLGDARTVSECAALCAQVHTLMPHSTLTRDEISPSSYCTRFVYGPGRSCKSCFNRYGLVKAAGANLYRRSISDDQPDPCEPNPCQNGAKCENQFPKFFCKCPTGYHGDFCDNECSVGQIVQNETCVDCEIGSFSEYDPTQQAGGRTCTLCPPGTYADTAGSSECTICSPGTYQEYSGMSRCEACAQSKTEGAKECQATTECDQGHYFALDGSNQCEPCPPGTFSDMRDSLIQCDQCEPGTYSNASGSFQCTSCGENAVATDFGAVLCTECPPGYYSSHIDGAKEGCSKGCDPIPPSPDSRYLVTGACARKEASKHKDVCEVQCLGSFPTTVGDEGVGEEEVDESGGKVATTEVKKMVCMFGDWKLANDPSQDVDLQECVHRFREGGEKEEVVSSEDERDEDEEPVSKAPKRAKHVTEDTQRSLTFQMSPEFEQELENPNFARAFSTECQIIVNTYCKLEMYHERNTTSPGTDNNGTNTPDSMAPAHTIALSVLVGDRDKVLKQLEQQIDGGGFGDRKYFRYLVKVQKSELVDADESGCLIDILAVVLTILGLAVGILPTCYLRRKRVCCFDDNNKPEAGSHKKDDGDHPDETTHLREEAGVEEKPTYFY